MTAPDLQRPWPAPRHPWVMSMRWHDLLFAHWPIDARAIESLLPRGLHLDTWQGQAWIGIVPFWMSRIRPRFLPPMPWVSSFAEINVRTYVIADEKPGVWFFSLDATNPLAVRAARWFCGLAYRDAAIDMRTGAGGAIEYHSRRRQRAAAPEFDGTYWPVSDPAPLAAGTLEHWLIERYCLYSSNRAGLWRLEIDHPPWRTQAAQLTCRANSMAAP